ncbi:MAG: hypothetical protein ACFB20_08270 [Opitutales bacterium]
MRAALTQGGAPEESLPPPAADARLNAFAGWCVVYRQQIETSPGLWLWLESTAIRGVPLRFSTLKQDWARDHRPRGSVSHDPKAWVARLRAFRRQQSLRIAYRDLGEQAGLDAIVADLTVLAEFVLATTYDFAWERNAARLGEPWDAALEAPARGCVLGLGKLGSQELNFCSDVDLIFFFEGQGHCRRPDGREGVDNAEFFGRVFGDLARFLSQRGPEGVLYNVDLRLRPEGEGGPLVRTFTGLANYYWANGQTWERLALMKARAVAGDRSLGVELLEEVNPFRYPRHPPPHLLPEIMGVKLRIEKEVVGAANLERDIKNGPGGIREIEFQLQARQMIEGGRSPFLQTTSTREALEQLERYEVIAPEEAAALRAHYAFLRTVENRLQMRRETRTHLLPEPGSEERLGLARSLGFGDVAAFEAKLEAVRRDVRARYEALFGADDQEAELQDWTVYLSGHAPSTAIEAKLTAWFPGEQDCAERLRTFAVGSGRGHLMRENVQLFLDSSRCFADVFAQLAEPLTALERVGGFAGSYGARKQFYKACNANPSFFKALCLLFDRSAFIHQLLVKHPGIMEELLHEAPRRSKGVAAMEAEIAHLSSDPERFADLLWLYVKAEQVRLAMGELLYERTVAEVTADLSDLAEATVRTVLRRVDPQAELTLVALGKFGGRELAFGSDLDVMVLGPVQTEGKLAKKASAFIQQMQYGQPLGRIFEMDLRLRPHGAAGALVTTLPAFEQYHGPEGAGQSWERTALSRARIVAGNEQLGAQFVERRDALLYERPLRAEAVAHLRTMQARIQREKVKCAPPQLAFKAGPGGLVCIEFMAQLLQRWLGGSDVDFRQTNVRGNLQRLASVPELGQTVATPLVDAYDLLRRVEVLLRCDAWTGVSEIPADARTQRRLASWLGYASFETLLGQMQARMAEVEAASERIFAFLPGS